MTDTFNCAFPQVVLPAKGWVACLSAMQQDDVDMESVSMNREVLSMDNKAQEMILREIAARAEHVRQKQASQQVNMESSDVQNSLEDAEDVLMHLVGKHDYLSVRDILSAVNMTHEDYYAMAARYYARVSED